MLLLPLAVGMARAGIDSMAERTRACTQCHGEQGRAAPDGYYPRIAGKPAGYLYNQLLHFKEGRRHYGLMTQMVDPLSAPYLLEIARHFAALELPYPPPVASRDATAAARGRVLALQGDATRQLPACASCHGERLTGMLPATPGLLGLPRDYVVAQLGAWRAGQRQAHAPDCMAGIARRLGPDDAAAVATWLAAQPVTGGGKPAPANAAAVAATCGSAALPAAAAPPPAEVARGAYLARAGNCLHCHTQRGGAEYAGGRAMETPYGTLYSSNLTPNAETGLGRWSADDFWQALHHGRSRDGRLLYPAFPYPSFTLMPRADSDALFAWLRTLPAVRRANTAHALRWPYRTQAALMLWRALYFRPGEFQADPARDAAWNRGAYLVRGPGHCSACHSERNALGAETQPLDLAGGMIPMQNWYAPSLVAPAEAGVAGWPRGDVVQLLRDGRSERASVLGPMADVVLHSTQHLSRADLEAMAIYLQALPKPTSAAPAAGSPVKPAGSPGGAKLYADHCAACHGKDGAGVAGAYPALAGNRAVTMRSGANLVQIVLAGGYAPATAGNPRPYGMPPFATVLSEADVAAVLTHIRSAWGNQAPPVTALDVNQARSRAR